MGNVGLTKRWWTHAGSGTVTHTDSGSVTMFTALRYLRHRTFKRLLAPFSRRARRRRMQHFVRLMKIKPGTRILDLGGTPSIWQYVEVPLEITILNLPGKTAQSSGQSHHHKMQFVEGNGCAVPQFEDMSFDLVFSNSVIEHVGPEHRQDAIAAEVRRLGKSYWVQTPSKWFPIEAHCGMPLWWFYPEKLRSAFLRGWRRKLPTWTQMVSETRVLERRRLEQLFPGCRIYVERRLGWPKSYTAFVVGDEVPGIKK